MTDCAYDRESTSAFVEKLNVKGYSGKSFDGGSMSEAGKAAEHSPLPWHQARLEPVIIVAADRARVADCHIAIGMTRPEGQANSAFIVKAVNNHESLLAAAKAALEWFAGFPHQGAASAFDTSTAGEVYAQLTAAIANAEKGG